MQGSTHAHMQSYIPLWQCTDLLVSTEHRTKTHADNKTIIVLENICH